MAILVLHRETPRYIKENCGIETINIHESSTINYLLDDSAVPNTFQTLELNYLKLDGKKKKNVELINGAWSNDLSWADGRFRNVPELIFTFSKKYSSNGLTLWFEKNIFCTDMEILCYNDDDLIVNENIYPDSEYVYFKKQITDFNKIHLKFNAINVPDRRFRLFRIDFGKSYLFTDEKIDECHIFEEIDYYSTSYIENTASISIKDIEHKFERGETVDVFQNGQEINSFVINQIKIINSDVQQLVCGDVMGDYQNYFTDDELIEFQDAIETGFDGLQVKNKFKIKELNKAKNKLLGTAVRTSPLEFLMLHAFINDGHINIARGYINIISNQAHPRKIDLSRIKGEISTESEYFYNEFEFKWNIPYSSTWYAKPGFTDGKWPAPNANETKVYQYVSGEEFYSNFKLGLNQSSSKMTVVKNGIGWALIVNDKGDFVAGGQLVGYWEKKTHVAYAYENSYKNKSKIGDKLKINISLASCMIGSGGKAVEPIYEAKKNLFVNKHTTTYNFYLILENEMCGDLITFPLKTGEEKTGVIQTIDMYLQGKKNIAKIEVVCVE